MPRRRFSPIHVALRTRPANLRTHVVPDTLSPIPSPPMPLSDDTPLTPLLPISIPSFPSSPSSSAATLPPPSPNPSQNPPRIPPPVSAPPAREVPILLDYVAARTAELTRLRADLRVQSQRLVALHAAASGADASAARAPANDAARAEDCPICLDKLLAPTAALARCGHMFHRHCIEQHLAHRSTAGCPICRQHMHTAELVQVMSGIPEAAPTEGGRRRGRPNARKTSKEEAVVVCLDDDGDEVIDLVDGDGSGDDADGDAHDGVAEVEDGPVELGRLSRAVERVLRAVEQEIKSAPVVAEAAAAVRREGEREKKRLENKFKVLKEEQEVVTADLKKERRSARAEVADLRHRQEELRQKEGEVNEELSTAKKLRMDWDLRKKEMEVRERELDIERAKVSEEQLECLREKKRYEALVKTRQRKEREKEVVRGEGGWQEGRKKRRVEEEDEEEEEGSGAVGEFAVDEITISGIRSELSPEKKGGVHRPEKPLEIFGSQLQKPSSLNRPAAPRRGRGGLSAFAPKRAKVQRPSAGIGSRATRRM